MDGTDFESYRDHILCDGYRLHHKEVEGVSIGSNIRHMREAKGFTQAELASNLNITQSMLCQIERGTKTLSLPLSIEIAGELGCEVNDLLASPMSENTAQGVP